MFINCWDNIKNIVKIFFILKIYYICVNKKTQIEKNLFSFLQSYGCLFNRDMGHIGYRESEYGAWAAIPKAHCITL